MQGKVSKIKFDGFEKLGLIIQGIQLSDFYANLNRLVVLYNFLSAAASL
jgi:hypothetical protein